MTRLNQRRMIFAGLFIVVAITMSLNIQMDMKASPYTQKLYDFIEELPDGSTLMLSFDHEASSLPEIRPLAEAVLEHVHRKKHKLIGVSLFAEGTLIGYRLMTTSAERFDRTYGEDYVYLGFRPQYIAAILSMGESLKKTYPLDYLGSPYDNFELLRSINNYDQIDAVVSIADGSLTTHWIEYGQANYDVKIVGAVTAAMVTTYDPYLASNQMYAMMGGLRGAAEYEQLLQIKGGGARGMLAQSSAHLYVLAMIILGNILYFVERKKKGAK